MSSVNLSELSHKAIHAIVALLVAFAALMFVLVTLLADVLRVALDALRGFAVVIVRVACVVACVAGIVVSFGPVWSSFGGDVAALISSVVLLLSPVAFVAVIDAGFGGLLLAGGMAFVLGAVLPALHPMVRGLLLVVLLAATIYQSMQGASRHEQEQG